jgi:hypothetical protein
VGRSAWGRHLTDAKRAGSRAILGGHSIWFYAATDERPMLLCTSLLNGREGRTLPGQDQEHLMSTWSEFISGALAEREDSEQVRRLRKELESGARLVRINLFWEDRRELPQYDVVLAPLGKPERVHIQVPHSANFMRWALESKARLASHEEEGLRTLFLLQEQLRTLEQEWGSTYFDSILVNHLRTLGPPRTVALLAGLDEYPAPESETRARALSAFDGALEQIARDLKTLGYIDEQVARLLDRALEQYVDDRFHLRTRWALLGR